MTNNRILLFFVVVVALFVVAAAVRHTRMKRGYAPAVAGQVGAANRPKGFKEAWLSFTLAGVVICGAVLLPYFFASGSGFISDAALALAFVVMALGLNIVVGFAGLLDLGYVAFYAMGAYTIGWFGSGFFTDRLPDIHVLVNEQLSSLPGIHLNYIIIAVIAMALAAVLGAIIGFPTLRLRGDYIAIVTLAFGEIIYRVAVNGDSLFGGFNLTNGRTGINPIDKPDLPLLGQFSTFDLRPWYYLALILALIFVFVNLRLRDSRLGRSWIAIREDEVAAVSMGIPNVRTKLYAYGLGAALGGVAGTFIGAFFPTVNADQFAFSFSIFVLAMIILGGLGSIWGVVLGAIVLTFINYSIIPDVLNGLPSKVGLDFDLTQLGFGIFGFLLVIMMVLRPQGLIPEKRRAQELTEGLEDHDQAYVVSEEAPA